MNGINEAVMSHFKGISMTQQKTVFGNTALKYSNKGGTLKPDEYGYYTVVLGALDVFNSGGEQYVLSDVSRNTFAEGSKVDMRAKEGMLKGEWGHPKPSDFPNPLRFEGRVRQLYEDRICHTIRKVYLQEIEYMGKKVLGIIGELKPCGPYGGYLKEMLDDPHQNVCFSGRYYSNVTKVNGIIRREIHTCGTWDYVCEPGVYQAKKYASPSLESEAVMFAEGNDGVVVAMEAEEVTLSKELLEQAYRNELGLNGAEHMSLESSCMSVGELLPDNGVEIRNKLESKRGSFSW